MLKKLSLLFSPFIVSYVIVMSSEVEKALLSI